ncbi:ABC transporter ATP-binding protein [Bradyrhizobium sp. dw_411]|uniref:ABC transporter ATP-binding protein n=1 Tax=Bradyrhizobium sp. dw_411 TaxID=2720082 RepID=UPI001BCAE05F|nr:ABC transporter ATP-binding protein [Bradyrhizobium sp. dw_411]
MNSRSPLRHIAISEKTSAQSWRFEAFKVSKSYGAVVANDDVSVDLKAGEIHALLGENGAGKSTIMKILYGMELPDAGHVAIDDKVLKITSPADAIAAGIAMVHQHFMLVPNLTVLENLILGNRRFGGILSDRRAARAEISALAERYRIEVDLQKTVSKLSVGEQQRVEILKALVRGARILILDEPTAVLTPQEIKALGLTLRELAQERHGIFIVTHKLPEAMGLSDRVSVMRRGRLIGTWPTDQITSAELVMHMVGRSLPESVSRPEVLPGPTVLELRDICIAGHAGRTMLQNINLEIAEGEILGVAGVEGNGQQELTEAIAGLRQVSAGDIFLCGNVITNSPAASILAAGVAHIPEDRHRDGVVLDFSLTDNAILVDHQTPAFQKRGVIDQGAVIQFTDRLINDYQIRCSGREAPMRSLSGGNQQKLVLGRELARRPKMLIAVQPTRGLDVGAIDYVHRQLIEQRSAGVAILLISTELDEIIALSDRIVVMREGRVTQLPDRPSIETIGAAMLGSFDAPAGAE